MEKFLIVCPLVFLAGFVDSIAGGGGLISFPAYMLAGVAGGLFYKKFYADNIVIPAATAAVCAFGKEHLMAVSVRLLGGTFSYFEMFFTYILPCTLATGLFCALTHLLMKPTLQRQIRKHYERHAGGGVR